MLGVIQLFFVHIAELLLSFKTRAPATLSFAYRGDTGLPHGVLIRIEMVSTGGQVSVTKDLILLFEGLSGLSLASRLRLTNLRFSARSDLAGETASNVQAVFGSTFTIPIAFERLLDEIVLISQVAS